MALCLNTNIILPPPLPTANMDVNVTLMKEEEHFSYSYSGVRKVSIFQTKFPSYFDDSIQ